MIEIVVRCNRVTSWLLAVNPYTRRTGNRHDIAPRIRPHEVWCFGRSLILTFRNLGVQLPWMVGSMDGLFSR